MHPNHVHLRNRAAVGNDNPYIESTFRTLKHRPALPVTAFDGLSSARRWASERVHGYNNQHRHSAIGFVTPSQRHSGEDRVLLQQHQEVYALARNAHPNRWSGQTRDWSHINVVHLNPDTPSDNDHQPTQRAA